MPSYPERPGSKGADTSVAAGAAISGRTVFLRARCLDVLREAPGGMTADEVAAHIGQSVLTIRPRISELKNTGEIRDAGVRRRNASGNTAAVWVANADVRRDG